jgi:hypothetical protein
MHMLLPSACLPYLSRFIIHNQPTVYVISICTFNAKMP